MKAPLLVCMMFSLIAVADAHSQQTLTAAAGIEFVHIPKGQFIYGKFTPPYPVPDNHTGEYRGYNKEYYEQAKIRAEEDARPGFHVSIPKPFFLSRFEITQQQWNRVMGDNPSFFKADSLPVESVTYEEAQAFTERLNEIDTLHHYRLPDEFEWEYAARAGKQDDISWDEIREQAQLGTKSTNTGGKKKPNAWGLYDMLGNVWEWTSTRYNEKIFADSASNTGFHHVLKGASFTGDVKNATYMTHAAGPGNRWDVGFRVLMEDRNYEQPEKEMDVPKNSRLHVPPPGWHLSRTSHQGATPLVQIDNNGMITLQQNPYGQGGVLLSNRKYRNFEISLEVKIDSFCNGGIFLRSTESGQAYQVELSEPGGTGNLLGEMLSISKPAKATDKKKVWKANDWNHFKIRMTGEVPTITLWINGKQMWKVTQPQNDFIAGATEGMIGLQVHWSATYDESSRAFDMSSSWRPNGKHQFRKIRIRELK